MQEILHLYDLESLLKKGIILTAQGKETFTPAQVKWLTSHLDVKFIENLNELEPSKLITLVKDAEILGITRRATKNISREILRALPLLQGIALYSTGYEWVDLDCAKECGIHISYLPDYSAQTVAEHTIGVILSMSRRIHVSYDRVRGIVPESTSIRGFELAGKELGILGCGTIGEKIAHMACAFNMNVSYHDVNNLENGFIYRESIEDLFKKSDVLVLMTPLTRGEKPLIGENEISLMKPGVLIINTSREGLVENQALIRGVKSGTISGYAVDEKVDELLKSDVPSGSILQTGHSAWYSNEAIERGTEQWVNNIIGLAMDKPIHTITGV